MSFNLLNLLLNSGLVVQNELPIVLHVLDLMLHVALNFVDLLLVLSDVRHVLQTDREIDLVDQLLIMVHHLFESWVRVMCTSCPVDGVFSGCLAAATAKHFWRQSEAH